MSDSNTTPSPTGLTSRALFAIEGELRMYETDGGFLPYSASIGGEDVVQKIAEAVGNLPEEDSRGYCLKEEGLIAKRVRVTVEVLDMANAMDEGRRTQDTAHTTDDL